MLHFQFHCPDEFYKGPETTALARTGIGPGDIRFGRYFLAGCPFEGIFSMDISILAEDLAARLINYSRAAGQWIGIPFSLLRNDVFAELEDYDFLMSKYVEELPPKKPARPGFQERKRLIPSSEILVHLRNFPGEASAYDLTGLLSPVFGAMESEGFIEISDKRNYVVACSSQIIIPTQSLVRLLNTAQTRFRVYEFLEQNKNFY